MKFDEVLTSHDFVENKIDQCSYLKISERNFIFLILHVNEILLVSSNLGLLHKTKEMLIANFEMKDLWKVFFLLDIEIYCDRGHGLLELSQ